MQTLYKLIKQLINYVLPAAFILFYSCGGPNRKADINNDGGMKYLLQVSVPDIIRTNTLKGLEVVDSTIKSAKTIVNSTNGTFIEVFVTELYKNPGLHTVQFNGLTDGASASECLKFVTQKTNETSEKIKNVLVKRFGLYGLVNASGQCIGSDGRITVELPGAKPDKRLSNLLITPGSLEFWETYDNKDIAPLLLQANKLIKQASISKSDSLGKLLKEDSSKSLTEQLELIKAAGNKSQEKMENSFFDKLSLATSYTSEGKTPSGGPVLGYALLEDTASVMQSLLQPDVKRLFPRNLRFLWGSKPIDSDGKTFQLLALKAINELGKGAALSGEIITRAEKLVFDGPPQISIEMTEQASLGWSNLTKDNIGNSIAIVIDNAVYSYPTVQGEITGGKSSITGDFTQEEADDFVNILNSGRLEAQVSILQEKPVLPLSQ